MADAEPLAPLTEAIDAGRTLGLDVERADGVRRESRERLGLVPDAYVVAFVGGTGVGKSTLLNALSGSTVSAAGVRRPTTAVPLAWVAADAAEQVAPLLHRLGVDRVATHQQADLRSLVIVDLPDLDSLEPSHRALVESVLPKLDVVAWVTDPEKYADAVLHDDFLREWLPRLERQAIVLNKVDRLDDEARGRVMDDLRGVLARDGRAAGDLPIFPVSAANGAAGTTGLREWLAANVEAKAVIAARLAAAARSAIAELADEVGVLAGATPGRSKEAVEPTPLVPEPARRRAIEGATQEALRVLDLRGVERQAVAATRARARRKGTGPIGLLTSAIYRFSGRQRSVADPAGYLRAWRGRGGLTRAAEQVQRAITDALPGTPPALRGRFAAAGESAGLERRLGEAIDRVVAQRGEVEPPSSRWWPAVGLLQSANTVLLIVAAAWIVLWVIARPEVASYELPIVGPMPAPIVWLAIALIAGYVLARLLSLHAGFLGRRWARRLTGDVRSAVESVVREQAFAPLAEIDAARATILRASARANGSRSET
ncbi:MAG TPA: GTPase [Candidatus Limnocylindria bacterium]|nr:GTPase [Candidatus Limnocylindria bacterium]